MTRLARTIDGRPMLGDSKGYVPLSSTDPSLSTIQDALPLAAKGELPGPDEAVAARIPSEKLSFAPPLRQSGKLWGIGLNYADHASDLDENRPTKPASFMKPPSTARGPGGPIRLPPSDISDYITAEAELAVVIGKTCSNIDESGADEVVAGYLPIIDMTAEDILKQNPRFLTRAKSFDTFFIFGPSIVTIDEVGSIDELSVKTVINEEVIAENRIQNMMTSPRELVAFHSKVMTLEPGDVISTGTPGAGHIVSGDSVMAEIERVGTVCADVV